MEQKPRLSIIIPAYNEAKRLPLTLVDMKKHLDHVDFPYEVIVVDNGSKDSTVDIVLRFEHLWNELRLVECKPKGKGAAVQKGMAEAKGDLRAFVDADNSISIDQVIDAMQYEDKGQARSAIASQIAGQDGELVHSANGIAGAERHAVSVEDIQRTGSGRYFPANQGKALGIRCRNIGVGEKDGVQDQGSPRQFHQRPEFADKTIFLYRGIMGSVQGPLVALYKRI